MHAHDDRPRRDQRRHRDQEEGSIAETFLKCTSDKSSCSWETTEGGGEGPFAAPPGTLAAGNVYRVVVDGEGEAAIGSWTGTGPA